MNSLPSNRECLLADGRVQPLVAIAATVVRDFPVECLGDVEHSWSPAREQLVREMTRGGFHFESGHWDWRNKAWPIGSKKYRLFAVECEGEVQGLMALVKSPRPAILSPKGSIVYVDYVEAAPWNLRQPMQRPRFLGVGSVLIGEAIRASFEHGLAGRVGLHSLPQAELFYSDRCGMTSLGVDANYHGLVYYEYDAITATQWLIERGMDR